MATPNTIQKIRKHLDGSVSLLNKFDVALGVLSSNTQIRRNEAKDGFILTDNVSGKKSLLWVSELLYYIIDPDPAVAYLADIWDWWLLMRRSFFPITKPFATTEEIANGSDVDGSNVTDALNELQSQIAENDSLGRVYNLETKEPDLSLLDAVLGRLFLVEQLAALNSLGNIPIGCPIAVPNIAGMPSLGENWQLCNGAAITDDRSLMKGQNTPNLIEKFIRFDTTAGGTGGTPTHSHPITIPTNPTLVSALLGGTPVGEEGLTNTDSASSLPPYINFIPYIRIF